MMEVSVPTHHCLGFTFFRDCSSSRWMSFSTAMRRRTPGRHTLQSVAAQQCETIALAAIKVLHCNGGARAGGIPATHVSEAPMLLYLLLPLLPVCNPSSSAIKSMVFF